MAPDNGVTAIGGERPPARVSEVGIVPVSVPGRYHVGRLLGYRDAKPRTVGTATFTNCDIGLTVDDELVTVQAPSRDEALKATGNATEGDLVAIRFETRSGIGRAFDDGRPGRPYSFDVVAGATAPRGDFRV